LQPFPSSQDLCPDFEYVQTKRNVCRCTYDSPAPNLWKLVFDSSCLNETFLDGTYNYVSHMSLGPKALVTAGPERQLVAYSSDGSADVCPCSKKEAHDCHTPTCRLQSLCAINNSDLTSALRSLYVGAPADNRPELTMVTVREGGKSEKRYEKRSSTPGEASERDNAQCGHKKPREPQNLNGRKFARYNSLEARSRQNLPLHVSFLGADMLEFLRLKWQSRREIEYGEYREKCGLILTLASVLQRQDHILADPPGKGHQ
ncbi:hypothetical protein STEG23_010797, partial [Scotinomys teguina]